jgi:hypothetical protein
MDKTYLWHGHAARQLVVLKLKMIYLFGSFSHSYGGNEWAFGIKADKV